MSKNNNNNDDGGSCFRTCSDYTGIGCCISEDDYKRRRLAEVVQNEHRHCTDLPCLLLLIAVFVIQIVLIVYADDNGADPNTLLHGYDYQGNWCDDDNDEGSMNAWVDLDESFKVRICITDCDETESDPRIAEPYESEEFLDAYCIPKDTDDWDAFDDFGDYSESLQRGISDIDTAKWMILISAFIALFFGFVYLKIVEIIGGVVVWLTIIAFFVGGIIGAWLLIEDGIDNYDNDSSSDTAKVELAIGIIILLLLGCSFCALFWLKKRIELALQMLDEAGNAINDMKSLILFPVLYSIPVMLYFAFWVAVSLYIYSAKEEHTRDAPDWLTSSSSSLNTIDSYVYYDWDEGLQEAMIFNFIALLYIMQVLIYFGFMVLSGVIADWYFSEWDTDNEHKKRGDGTAELSNTPILESIWRVLRFHLGSLAFGALIITIIRVIRATLYYIEKKTKAADNQIVKCILCCVQCCLACCQCILDKCSKEGFIFCSVYGTNFCYSSYTAIKLIWSNIGRTAMVEGISKYMEIIGRFGIALLTTGVSIIVFRELEYYNEHLSSYIYPAIPVFIISYLIGALFMMVLEVAVDTIFLCFLVDEVVHSPPKFASNKLMELAASHSTVMTPEAGAATQKNIVPDTTTAV